MNSRTMNFLQGLLLLGCIHCRLCQQTPAAQFMAQVNEFCSTHCQSAGGVTAPPRVGKAGPIGLPGIVDYTAINSNLTNMFNVLEGSLNTRLENAIVEQSALGSQDIRQIREEISVLKRLAEFLLVEAWFKTTSNGYAYGLITAKRTWEEAAEDCRSKGAILISAGLRDPTARAEILDIMGSRPFWIGVSDIAQEGRWVWEDGVQSDGNDVGWSPGEPNDHGKGEDCGYFRKSGGWSANDYSCQTAYDYIQHYLCEPTP